MTSIHVSCSIILAITFHFRIARPRDFRLAPSLARYMQKPLVVQYICPDPLEWSSLAERQSLHWVNEVLNYLVSLLRWLIILIPYDKPSLTCWLQCWARGTLEPQLEPPGTQGFHSCRISIKNELGWHRLRGILRGNQLFEDVVFLQWLAVFSDTSKPTFRIRSWDCLAIALGVRRSAWIIVDRVWVSCQ